MKTDLISRSAVLEELERKIALLEQDLPDERFVMTIDGLEEASDVVEDAPAIDAVPVVHARWIDGEEDFCMGWISCSACDFLQTKYDHEGNLNDFDFCPHCGARMDGEAE